LSIKRLMEIANLFPTSLAYNLVHD